MEREQISALSVNYLQKSYKKTKPFEKQISYLATTKVIFQRLNKFFIASL